MTNTKAIGIDLGTTYSVLAYLDANGQPKSVPNSEGDLITPSAVYLEDSGVVVGKEALKAGLFEPNRLAQFAKRDMGQAVFSKRVNGEQFPPEVIQSHVLAKLKRDAEQKLGKIEQVVITVPAYFNEPRRKATQDVGRLAGLQVLDIINEPTAAAIAFGVEQGFLNEKGESKRSERVVIYDLGGGTFDVTVMEIDGQNYTVRATGGDVYLGGIDWDARLANHLATEFLKEFPECDPRTDPVEMIRLHREAEEAKRSLSAKESATVLLDIKGHRAKITVSRAEFVQLTADLLERTRFTTQTVLKESGFQWSDITRLLLAGGSSRMPMVARMLQDETGRVPDGSLSLDEAVAHGAAIYAGIKLAMDSERPPKTQIQNVNSHNLCVLGTEAATGRPRSQVMIPRNTPLPAKANSRFKTQKPNQLSVVVQVVEGGDASGNHATSIGRCVIRDLPPGLPQGSVVEVQFDYAANGRLAVTAALPSQNRTATLVIERASGMTDDDLNAWTEHLAAGKTSKLDRPGRTPLPDEVAVALPESPPEPPPLAARVSAPPPLAKKGAPPPVPPPRPNAAASRPPKIPPPLPSPKTKRSGPPPLPPPK
jgi:molecular chaperone DnaK